MQVFTIKRNDTAPALRYALLPDTVDLTGAAVVFNMRGGPVRAAATVVTVNPPVVEYPWQASDTQKEGVYLAEFEVTYADGAVETFPTTNDLIVKIVPDLG